MDDDAYQNAGPPLVLSLARGVAPPTAGADLKDAPPPQQSLGGPGSAVMDSLAQVARPHHTSARTRIFIEKVYQVTGSVLAANAVAKLGVGIGASTYTRPPASVAAGDAHRQAVL